MAHIICIASQKGGTGKTTTAVNLAGSLALFEKKTLIVDCDPLGNATTGLGIEKKTLSRDLFTALSNRCSFGETIVSTELEFLKLVPSRFDLLSDEDNEGRLTPEMTRLRMLLLELEKQWDYIIIDSPPSLSHMAICAMVASDWLLIPMQCQIFTLESLGNLLRVVRHIHRQIGRGPRIAGILFTLCEYEESGCLMLTSDLLKGFEKSLIRTTIPRDRLLQDAADFGKPLVLHDIMAEGARAYLHLGLELVEFFNNTAVSGNANGEFA